MLADINQQEYEFLPFNSQSLDLISESKSRFVNDNNHNHNNIDNISNSNKSIINNKSRRYSSFSYTESDSHPILSSKSFDSGYNSILSASPFGPMNLNSNRKTFVNLIGILNAIHPDHDFSNLQPIDFQKEKNYYKMINKFNNTLIGLGKTVSAWMWEAIDFQIDLKESIVYTYSPSSLFLDDDPGFLWSTMWFIVNKKRKRVCFLYVNAVRHPSSPLTETKKLKKANDEESAVISDDGYDEEYDLRYDDENIVGDLEME